MKKSVRALLLFLLHSTDTAKAKLRQKRKKRLKIIYIYYIYIYILYRGKYLKKKKLLQYCATDYRVRKQIGILRQNSHKKCAVSLPSEASSSIISPLRVNSLMECFALSYQRRVPILMIISPPLEPPSLFLPNGLCS